MSARLEIHEPRCDGQRTAARPTQLLPMCWHCERRLDVKPEGRYTWLAESPAKPPARPDGRWSCDWRRGGPEPKL